MTSRTLYKLVTLPPRAWLALLEIMVVSLGVEIGLRMVPIKRLLHLSCWRPIPPTPLIDTARLEELSRLAAAVFRRYPFRLTCLKRTLILSALLRRRGVPVDLKIGVAKTADTLHAHAWLEQDGQVVFEDPATARQFQAVLSLASSP